MLTTQQRALVTATVPAFATDPSFSADAVVPAPQARAS